MAPLYSWCVRKVLQIGFFLDSVFLANILLSFNNWLIIWLTVSSIARFVSGGSCCNAFVPLLPPQFGRATGKSLLIVMIARFTLGFNHSGIQLRVPFENALSATPATHRSTSITTESKEPAAAPAAETMEITFRLEGAKDIKLRLKSTTKLQKAIDAG